MTLATGRTQAWTGGRRGVAVASGGGARPALSPDVLTLTFARRFAEHKRSFHDPRHKGILLNFSLLYCYSAADLVGFPEDYFFHNHAMDFSNLSDSAYSE